MFIQVLTPEYLSPDDLDSFLAQGWFRMGQTIFTTNFLRVKNEIHSTIWLRILLAGYEADNTQLKLFRKNSVFRTTFGPSEITPEKESLYSRYKEIVPFQTSDSLHQLMFGRSKSSIYTTYEVTVHDNNKLIACGFFDIGANSAEGIASFYDPDYKKNSLGKFLIYQKVQYCKSLGLQYFYPGYFVPGNPHFDYKLSIGKDVLEFLQLKTQSWLPIRSFTDKDITMNVMKENLFRVQELLMESNRESQLLKYKFFDADFIPDMRNTGLLDFPVILLGAAWEEGLIPVVVFDVRDGMYHLGLCVYAWKPIDVTEDEGFYADYYLMPVQKMGSAEGVEEAVEKFEEYFHKNTDHQPN